MKTMSNFPAAPESNIKQKQSMATFIAVDKCFYTSSFDCRETNLPAIKTKLWKRRRGSVSDSVDL